MRKLVKLVGQANTSSSQPSGREKAFPFAINGCSSNHGNAFVMASPIILPNFYD